MRPPKAWGNVESGRTQQEVRVGREADRDARRWRPPKFRLSLALHRKTTQKASQEPRSSKPFPQAPGRHCHSRPDELQLESGWYGRKQTGGF